MWIILNGIRSLSQKYCNALSVAGEGSYCVASQNWRGCVKLILTQWTWQFQSWPSKHDGFDPDRLGSISQNPAWWYLRTSLHPDWICEAKTWHSQPQPNWIRAGFAQYDPGFLWKNTTESESGKLVRGQYCSARIRPDDSCTLTYFRTRCLWQKSIEAIKIRSGLVLHNVIWAFFGRTEPNWMQEVGSDMLALMAITGHNRNTSELILACLLGLAMCESMKEFISSLLLSSLSRCTNISSKTFKFLFYFIVKWCTFGSSSLTWAHE